ncbi:MAG TPA: aminoglycoside phosphotransferase family protein [Pyrinomonadaceae bacterium]|jgi:streptomycin 6-kinase
MFDALPQKFKETILGAFREKGKSWLARLPEIIKEIEENWRLSAAAPFPNLSYHYVAPCVCADGGEAVLKIGFPGEAAYILNEVKMLRFLDGGNSVELLRFDEKRFAFLLEKLTPGENLKTIYQNDKSTAVDAAINVMRAFWREAPGDVAFPGLEDWFENLKKAKSTEFNSNYVKKALGFFDELMAASKQKTLLHGDFHHENILSATRAPFLAIDPKGITGDTGYDISIFLINHARWLEGEPDLREKLNETIQKFSNAFEIEPDNLRKWVYAHSVLSAWWTFEENSENWKDELDFAEIWEV